jgi:hypothetical protein
MRRVANFGLWWVPLLLVFAPLFGRMPAHRDLIDYVSPMRAATAEMLGRAAAPWLNLANGCGEAWFANPQTGVLYPPAWLHIVLPGPWAMAAEVGVHLALLSLGAGLLARKLGAGLAGRLFTEVAAWSAGPVLVSVGVLMNLETLAWLPFMVLASKVADRRSTPLLAAATALAWLGGEPQVWAMGVVLVIAVAPRRGRAMVGVAIGVAVVAVQMIPFAVWVAEGDRGSAAAAWLLRGSLAPADWAGVLAPQGAVGGGRMVYAESLFLGPPVVLCALLGGWTRKWLLAAVALLGLLATLPEMGGGGIFVAITGGLVRYPSRFAMIGLAMLLPVVGRGAEDWLAGRGRTLSLVISAVTFVACAVGSHPWRWWVAGVPAVVMVVAALNPQRRWLRAVVLWVGGLAMIGAGLPLVDLRPTAELRAETPTWSEANDGGRVFTPTPANDVMGWLASGLEPRRLWPVGYLNLEEELVVARTDAPVANGRLAGHIAITEQGPIRRWWLDVLSARWVILPDGDGLPERMEVVRRKGGMRLLRNLDALPVVCLAEDRPDPEKAPRVIEGVMGWELAANRCEVVLDGASPGWLWLSIAPVEGWRWFLDGREIELEQGPGIVQYVEIPNGPHRLEGRYRPPALLPSALMSLVTAGLVVGLFSAAVLRLKFAPVAAAPEGTPRPGSDGTSGKTDATPTVGSTPLSAAGPRRLG